MTESRPHETVDWYELLEVSPRASHAVIHAAYRVLVRDSHPDRNPTPAAAWRIRRLNEGYRILGDPETRARYDLECARARRHQQISGASRAAPHALEPARAHAARVRSTSVARAAEERLPILTSQVLLGLMVLLAVAAVLLGLASALEHADDVGMTSVPVFELSRR